MKGLTLALAVLMVGLSGIGSASARELDVPKPLFHRGAELHLLPSYGSVGTKVQVLGLGYRPGGRVDVLAGMPGTEFALPLAHATVAPDGTFRTNFVVTCTLVTLTPGGRCPVARHYPLILGSFEDRRGMSFTHKATSAFIVTIS
jgi:hypothetical protein